jgi:hypothetical protein
MRRPWLVLLALAWGCASAPPRFTDGDVVETVHDDVDIPEPAEVEFHRFSHHLENFTTRQLRLRLNPRPNQPARDVNRLGEVPNSSWYENRIDRLKAPDVARGPGGDDPGPEAFKPWTITGLKIGGANPGFVFEDARGAKYICKFDKLGAPVIATAAGAVAVRLFWALGYHVPDDRVVFFQRSQLRLGEGTTVKSSEGEAIPVTEEHIDLLLAHYATRREDGSYRVLVSRFLPGIPKGGYAYSGTRADDPNDRIDHRNRRSLRGLRVFGAWLNHVDLKVDNTLDLYTEDDGRHFLRHYLVDFDGCLGGYWAARHENRIGFSYEFDTTEIVTGVATLGLIRHAYEDLKAPAHPYVGLYEAEVYDPSTWKNNYLNDHVHACRPADAFWAGTVLAGIQEDHVRAAVTAARFEDDDAEEDLIDVLMKRREKTLRWALQQVTPVVGLDRLDPGPDGLHVEAEDALRRAHLVSSLRYEAEVLDAKGAPLAPPEPAEPAVVIPTGLFATHDYLVVRWTATTREGRRLPPSEGHYRRRDGRWRLAGILRDGE